ncbi:MAG: OmpH family outer membrane protein [Thalassobaculum sp.]|uniref:OmpH family outer membrane protein n=1 Tax=Thalassobaculum sp. TaxID=2022740 RepID=UPI0032EEB617
MSARMAAAMLAALMSIAAPGGSAIAQTAAPSVAQAELPIAVVDVQGIMRAAKAAKAIHDQIETRRSAYQEEVAAEERRLRVAEQDLSQQRAVLAPDAYQQKVREFQTKVAEVQRQVQMRKRELDETFARAMNEVRKSLVAVVAEIAEQRGIKLVLFKSQIVIAEKSLDVSDETLQRLNERLPTVKVELPALK